MKKSILAASMIFSLFGLAAVAHAAAPVVSAGASQTIILPASTVTLTGTATPTSPATITSATWALTSSPSGATVSISPNALVASASGLTVVGNYVFTLTAIDSNSSTSSAATTITVNPAITNPVVNAGASQAITLPNNVVTLTGTATAAVDKSIASYMWTQTSGPTSVISTPTSATTLVSGLNTVGTYVFTLTATDNTPTTALTGSATTTVTVNPAGTTTTTSSGKMKLQINENGKAEIKGILESIDGTVLTVKVWGVSVKVNTAGGKFTGRVKDISLFKVGDYINAQGSIDTTASTLTINARNVNNLSVKTIKENTKRAEDKKKENEIKRVLNFKSNNGNDNNRGNKKDN